MPRVHRVSKARKPQGTCGKCGTEIQAGDAYIWWKFRYSGRRVRCVKPGCAPRPSDLTQSEFYGQLSEFDDRASDAASAETVLDAVDELRNLAEDVRQLGEECDEKRNNMPDSLQDSETGNLLQERQEACESLADEIESKADEIESEFEIDFNAEAREAFDDDAEWAKLPPERQDELIEEAKEAKKQELLSDISFDFGIS